MHLPQHLFLREDHTVDLLKARQALAVELSRVLGDFRDYNGGMIATQRQTLDTLKTLLGPLDNKENFLLENFFHALMPMEARNVVDYACIKELFFSLRESINQQSLQQILREEPSHVCLIMKSCEPFPKEKLAAWGKFEGIIYRDTPSSCIHIALVHGEPSEALETLAYNLKIPKTNLRNLGMSHTALPRGRVGLTADGVYTILHGDNSPPPHTLDAVINAYSLRELNRKGKVKAIVDHHEKIATDDLMALKKAIGTDFNLESEEPDMSWFDNLD
jgi:hypothetical protein